MEFLEELGKGRQAKTHTWVPQMLSPLTHPLLTPLPAPDPSHRPTASSATLPSGRKLPGLGQSQLGNCGLLTHPAH